MKDFINRLKQISDDLGKLIDDWERKEDKVDSRAIDAVAVKSIKKQLSYLRQFHDDEWIANKIGVDKRELRRWETARHKPRSNNGWALKALYDEERSLRGEDT